MKDVKDFFAKHYNPQNAILCIAGNFSYDEVYKKQIIGMAVSIKA